jgi:hypothetical protein
LYTGTTIETFGPLGRDINPQTTERAETGERFA